MASFNTKKALKRLQRDLHELTETPVSNLSAAPLESNMLEWHCNIYFNGNIYHLVLFFPEAYPAVSPKLEMMPPGFIMGQAVVRKGEKGTSVCLDIFSDFEDVHPEWRWDHDIGWSPCYTVKFMLLNLLSYFHEMYNEEDETHGLSQYIEVSKTFVCSDCGHCLQEPFPPLDIEEEREAGCLQTDKEALLQETGDITVVENENSNFNLLESKIVDYMSRETFSTSSGDQLFGYGLVLNVRTKYCTPTSPCEFLTASSFKSMCEALGRGKSILRGNLDFFLPLYITQMHATGIEAQFHETMAKIARSFRYRYSFMNNYTHVIVNVFCHLLSSIVDQICYSSRESIDNVFDGYFQIHRLFLWAIEKDPKVLVYVDKRLKRFLSNPNLKIGSKFVLDFDYFFALLSVSSKYTWEDEAETYMREFWRRSVRWCRHKEFNFLDMDMPVDNRLWKTFTFTRNSRNRLAFQMTLLKMVKPSGTSHEDILWQYEDNFSFPSSKTVFELRKASSKITKDTETFDDWFKVICLPVPSKKDLFNNLRESVKFAVTTRGYLG